MYDFLILCLIVWASVGVGFVGGMLCVKTAKEEPVFDPLGEHSYMTVTLSKSEYKRV